MSLEGLLLSEGKWRTSGFGGEGKLRVEPEGQKGVKAVVRIYCMREK